VTAKSVAAGIVATVDKVVIVGKGAAVAADRETAYLGPTVGHRDGKNLGECWALEHRKGLSLEAFQRNQCP